MRSRRSAGEVRESPLEFHGDGEVRQVDTKTYVTPQGVVLNNITEIVLNLSRGNQGVLEFVSKEETLREHKNLGFTSGGHCVSSGTGANWNVRERGIGIREGCNIAGVIGFSQRNEVRATADSVSVVVNLSSAGLNTDRVIDCAVPCFSLQTRNPIS